MSSNSGSHVPGWLLATLLAFTAHVGLAQERLDDIPGWQETRWGMSLDELIDLYGSRLNLEPGEEGGTIATLDYQVFGQDFVANFYWRDDGAALTTVHLRSNSDTARRNVAENFEGALTARYGRAEVLEHEEEKGPMGLPGFYNDNRKVKLRWVLPSTIVVYDYFSTLLVYPDAEPALIDILNITYQENQTGKL